MKIPHINTIRAAAFTFIAAAALSLSSCKEKGEPVKDPSDTIPPEGMSSVPGGDTIVKKNGDTVIQTGTANDTKENPIGTQVP